MPEFVWEGLEKQARESSECCEQWLMCNTGQSSEDQNGNGNVESKGQAQVVSLRAKTAFKHTHRECVKCPGRKFVHILPKF